jgi:hypothetical protein
MRLFIAVNGFVPSASNTKPPTTTDSIAPTA